MKKILLALLMVFTLSLTSCESYNEGEAVETEVKGNGDYNVKLLFEADGIKVYRFSDNGHYIYFTNKSGKAEYEYEHQVGKQIHNEKMQVLCNEDEEEED